MAVTQNRTVTATATTYIEQESGSLSQGSSVPQSGATTLATIPVTQYPASANLPAAGTTVTQAPGVTAGTISTQFPAVTTMGTSAQSLITTESTTVPVPGITTMTTGVQVQTTAVQAPLQTPKPDATQVPKPALPE